MSHAHNNQKLVLPPALTGKLYCMHVFTSWQSLLEVKYHLQWYAASIKLPKLFLILSLTGCCDGHATFSLNA